MKFSPQEQERLKTVAQVQDALVDRGRNPYQHLMWDHQRHVWSPMGSYVASRTGGGFRLDIVDRGSVLPRGVFPDEASMVLQYVTTVELHVPPTAEQQARATEAGRRASTENAAFRERYHAEMMERLNARDETSSYRSESRDA